MSSQVRRGVLNFQVQHTHKNLSFLISPSHKKNKKQVDPLPKDNDHLTPVPVQMANKKRKSVFPRHQNFYPANQKKKTDRERDKKTTLTSSSTAVKEEMVKEKKIKKPNRTTKFRNANFTMSNPMILNFQIKEFLKKKKDLKHSPSPSPSQAPHSTSNFGDK